MPRSAPIHQIVLKKKKNRTKGLIIQFCLKDFYVKAPHLFQVVSL